MGKSDKVRLRFAPEVLEIFDQARADNGDISLAQFLTWAGLAAADDSAVLDRGKEISDDLRGLATQDKPE